MNLPFGLETIDAALMAFGLFGAAFVRGFAGFGFSAIFISWVSLFRNPLPFIPMIFTCEIAMTALQARDIKADIQKWRSIPLALGAAVAVFPAVWLLTRFDDRIVRLVVPSIILVLSLALLAGWSFKNQPGRRAHFATGIASGAVNAAGVGGLPVAAFLSAQTIEASIFRATLIVHLTALDLMTLPAMATQGLVTTSTFVAAAVAFPVLILGVAIGTRQFRRTQQADFRKLAIFILVALSVTAILKGTIYG